MQCRQPLPPRLNQWISSRRRSSRRSQPTLRLPISGRPPGCRCPDRQPTPMSRRASFSRRRVTPWRPARSETRGGLGAGRNDALERFWGPCDRQLPRHSACHSRYRRGSARARRARSPGRYASDRQRAGGYGPRSPGSRPARLLRKPRPRLDRPSRLSLTRFCPGTGSSKARNTSGCLLRPLHARSGIGSSFKAATCGPEENGYGCPRTMSERGRRSETMAGRVFRSLFERRAFAEAAPFHGCAATSCGVP